MVNNIKIQDFCDMKSFFEILKNWSKTTGFSTVVVDTNGDFISESFGFSPLCELIQHSREGAVKCKCTWQDTETGIKKCHAGFYDIAIPILLPDGTYLGKVISGQSIPKEDSISDLYNKSSYINISQTKYSKLAKSIPHFSKSEMEGAYTLLKQIVDSFILKSYSLYIESEKRQKDITLLTAAIKTVYRITMYFNISKNEYHLIDHDYGVSNVVPLNGTIDQVVEIGVNSIPFPDQAKAYYDKFNRDALINSYNQGIKNLRLQHQQKTYDGEIHWMEARLVFVETKDPDLLAICLSRIIDEDINNRILLNEALDKTIKQKKELQDALDKYKNADYDRRRDFLTGLRNRQDLDDFINDHLSGKRNTITSMFMMDIDNFKKLNDLYGHSTGDSCLKTIGSALINYEKNNDMYFYRYGGEEILGICFSKNKDCDVIANELVKLISDLDIKRTDCEYGVVTISVGYTTNNSNLNEMINIADKAMYVSKNNGKNRATYLKQ